MDIKLRSLRKYQEFLETVIKANPDHYQNAEEILTRYKTLVKSNEHLERDSKLMENEYERLKMESSQFEKERNNKILQLSNDIKDLAKKKEVFYILIIDILFYKFLYLIFCFKLIFILKEIHNFFYFKGLLIILNVFGNFLT